MKCLIPVYHDFMEMENRIYLIFTAFSNAFCLIFIAFILQILLENYCNWFRRFCKTGPTISAAAIFTASPGR